MKYIIFLSLAFLFAYSAKNQDSTIALSQFEIFTGQTNRILKTELITAENRSSRPVNVFKTTDLTTGNSVYAIRVGYINSIDIPDLIHPEAIYIDVDELDAVISALTFFLKEAEKLKPVNGLCLSYATSNDIVFSYSYDKVYEAWRFDIRKVYKHLRTYIPNVSHTYHNKKRLLEFIEDLKTARTISTAN
jgi:hypothetical protein